MDYEKLVREKEIETHIWGKESIIVMDEDTALPENVILEKLAWIEAHKAEIIQFALNQEDFLEGINADIAQEIGRKGKYELYDGTILQNTIDEETLIKSIFVNSVYFDEEEFGIDLATSPDYFGGHLLAINVSENYEMEYEGMNG